MKRNLLLAFSLFFLINSGFSQQIQIDLNKQHQTIEGFGGFGAKKVWWDSAPYHDAEFLNQAVDVMGANIIRTQLYWDFEPVNDNNDPYVLDETKLKFGTTSDNGKQFAFLKDANAKGCKIMVSVWTPPLWMKDRSDPSTIPNECYNCMNTAWGCTKDMCGGVLKPEFYEEFAEYLVAYVKIVKKQTGVDIHSLSIQNEALFANPFESAVLKQKPYADLLKIVGARFVREGLPQLLFGPEHMAEYSWGGNAEYVNQLFNQSTAGKDYLDAFAVHGYLDGVANDYGSATGWTDLYNNVTVAHGKPLWMTETGNNVANTFDEGFKYSIALHLALKFGHISAWVFWQMTDNLIVGNTLTHTGNAMKTFYKHLKPGYINVEASTTDAGILVTAYKLNKSLVVVAINNATSSKTVQLNTGTTPLPSSFKVYRYSATETGNLVSTVTNNSFALPAKSVTTMVYEDITTGDTQAPTAPSLSTTGKTSTSVSLSWTAATDNVGVTGYDVYNGTTKVNTSTITGTAFTVSNLSASTAYNFTVKAFDAVGNTSTSSNTVSVTTNALTDSQAPTSPTLSTTGKTSSSVSLSWTGATDNVGVTGYDVYNGTTKVNTSAITGTTFIVTNLNASTAYNFTVRARDAAGNTSLASNTLSVTTAAPQVTCSATGNILREVWLNIPGTTLPTIPSSAPSSSTQLTIFESPIDVADDYLSRIRGFVCPPLTGSYTFWIASDDNSELWLSTSDNPANKVKIASVSDWTGSRDWVKYPSQKSNPISLIAGQKYYIEALHKEGSGGDNLAVGWDLPDGTQERPIPGSRLSPSTHDMQAPIAPTLSSTGKTSSSISLFWTGATDNVGVTGYDVYNGAGKVNTNAITGTTFMVSNLTASTAYNFTVKALDASGNASTASNTVSVTTNAAADMQAPTAPILSSTGKTTTSASLSWTVANDNVGVTGYDVYNGTTKVNTSVITGTNFTVNNLTASTAYNFTVKAFDAAGNTSAASNTVSVTTNAAADTQEPTAATLSSTGKTTTSVSLSWTASSDNVGVTGYDVYNGTTKVNTSAITGTTFTVNNLIASTNYNFTVKAHDAAGNTSVSSNTVSVTTNNVADTQAPTAPVLSSTGFTANSVSLSWTVSSDNVGVTGYTIYNGNKKVNATLINETTYNVTGLNANTTYDFKVIAFDEAGNASTASNKVTVTTTIVTAINPSNLENSTSLFPNPTTGMVFLKIDNDGQGLHTIAIYNIAGKKLQTTLASKDSHALEVPLNLSEYPSGIYYIEILNINSRSFKKVEKF